MNKFSQRSSKTELIDEPDIPFSDWEVCLRELNMVNTYLGGHSITVEGVKHFLDGKNTARKLTIVEIGSGGGDNLKAIHKWATNKNGVPPIHFIGIDINRACTDFAAENCKNLDAEFICSDYRAAQFPAGKPDIIFNSLFCHHFTNEQLVEMLRWMSQNSSLGFFINDLQRHPVAYHSIKLLTNIFSQSYLVKNDGPISVLRGFHRDEWRNILSTAGLSNHIINWRWAFRFLVSVTNEQPAII